MMITRPAPRRSFYDNPFWEYVNNHQLRLQQCASCSNRWYPPGPACPACNSEEWSWEPISGTATLLSWVTFARTYFPNMPAPYTVVACQTEEGPILLADTTADPASLQIGAPMTLRYYEAMDESSQPMTLYSWEPTRD